MGSGLNLHLMGVGCVGCRPRARLQEPAGQVLEPAATGGGPSVLPAFPQSPPGPATLPKSPGSMGGQGRPQRGQPAAHGPPPTPSTCPHPTCICSLSPRFWKLPDTFSP